MALSLFSKAKNQPEMPTGQGGKGFVPIDRVKDLSSKGFTEIDMIDVLRKEGFSPDEIDKALTEALKTGVAGITPPSAQVFPQLPTLEEIQPPAVEQQMQAPQMPETSLPQEYYYQQQQQQQQYPSEEYVEYMVKERMSEVQEKITQFGVMYDELSKRMEAVQDQIEGMAKSRTSGEELIVTKIDAYKDALNDVDIRMNSLEKAFKETLPALIEAVRNLSDLVQREKRESS